MPSVGGSYNSKGGPLYGIVLLEPVINCIAGEGLADLMAIGQDDVELVGSCFVASVGDRLLHAWANAVLAHRLSQLSRSRTRPFCGQRPDSEPHRSSDTCVCRSCHHS